MFLDYCTKMVYDIFRSVCSFADSAETKEEGSRMDKIIALFKKYREVLLYLIFGGLTTVVNYISMWLFYELLGIRVLDALGANTLAWIVSVAFAYVTNKLFVFESRDLSQKTLLREIISFVAARLISLGAESAVIYIGVTVLGGNLWIIKLLASVVVVILNYIFSKLIIFRKQK